MTWVQTRHGLAFDLLDPRAEDVHPDDIAWALAGIPRFNAHTTRFYSVAEHCCHVSDSLPDEFKLAGLLHDAPEAYMGDMTQPMKRALRKHDPAFEYAWNCIEDDVANAIAVKLGIETFWPLPAIVVEHDARILLDERDYLMLPSPRSWGPVEAMEPLGVKCRCWGAGEARVEWTLRLNELAGRRVL